MTPAAASALAALEIATVFDLATSGLFDDAAKIVRAGEDSRSALFQFGSPTGDLVNEAQAAGKQLGDLQFLPIALLQRIPAGQEATIAAALDVETVRDLALYPPYRDAVRLLTETYFPENAPGFDPERPADLLPRSGEYPTERVQYSTLLLDEIPLEDGAEIVDVAGPGFAPIDLAILAKADSGFKKTAFGALLTFNQSWFAQGVTLGQLLHSTALAPGESTRLAVIDWSRRSRAGETEVIDETDDLTNDQSHNRSISEVTRAVANEAQSGFSATNTNAQSSQVGVSMAAEMSAPLGGLLGGPSGSFGLTASHARSSSHADSYSTSFGHRDVGSTMTQAINDRTHQHAHSNRSRRASVVKEVSQSEHETVTTRVVANYNHMHTLMIQIYEVVQVFRVEVAIARADRVVFIPVQLIDFNNDDMIRRFQNVLAANALNLGISEALRKLETIEISPDQAAHLAVLDNNLKAFVREALRSRSALTTLDASPPVRAAAAPAAEAAAAAQPAAASAVAEGRASVSMVAALSLVQQVNEKIWRVDQGTRLAGLLNIGVMRPASTSLFLPTDLLVEGASVSADGAPVRPVFRDLAGRIIASVSADAPVALNAIGRISLVGSDPAKDVTAELVLTLNRNGVRFPVELPAVRIRKGATGETRLVTVKVGGADVNLKQHLRDNRMHYSQAIFRALDATQTALLLSGFGVQVGGKTVPVAQVVEPRAIRVVGNYMAFKMNSDAVNDESWSNWLTDHGIRIGATREDIVPLASGGTFAEAVLGRSNGAEKLDITRFWNWQDSPIPLQPTEIAAISTGSRAQPEDVKPGQLSTPVVNIMPPASLPDPVGTAAILQAIQNGSMFRDMSGLQATIGLAQAALQASAAGAATAGQQAGTNMDNLLKANTERQRIAADMIGNLARTAASVMTGIPIPGGGGSGGGNHSQDGAKINYFDKMKESVPAGGGGGANGGTGGPVPSGGSSGGDDGGSVPASPAPGEMGPSDWSQNPAILAATWGDGEPRSSLIQRAMDFGFGTELIEAKAGGSKGAGTKEINLVGDFKWEPALTDDELLAELAGNRWTPATADMGAVPGGNFAVVTSFGHMLAVIREKPVGSINRINLFTHANKDLIGFTGEIERSTVSRAIVTINDNDSDNSLTAITPGNLANFIQSGLSFTVGTGAATKTVTLEEIRKRFAKDAQIVLYACNSGQLPEFIKTIATFFGVKVVGFSVDIGYFPPAQNQKHMFKRKGMRVGFSFAGGPIKDWRKMVTETEAVVQTP